MGELPKTYESGNVEGRVYDAWLAAGVFHEEPDPARPPFIISMPPPNVTGRAHLGHGSTYTPMDVLTRYHRMLGENADWLPGQDHAAIATEAVLVRELAKEGHTRDGLGREAFLERAWEWRAQLRRRDQRAVSYARLRSGLAARTLHDGRGALGRGRKVFVELYREGLIYRGKRLDQLGSGSQSTLSDAEVDDVERDGSLWQIRYAREDGCVRHRSRDDAARDDARRRGDRRASRRRALRARSSASASWSRSSGARFRSWPTPRSNATSARAR